MDALITAHFFQISPRRNVQQRDFIEILAEAAALPHSQREREISNGVRVRVERHDVQGDFVMGEFSRVQQVNVPPFTTPEGLSPIPMAPGRGIGHVAAFQYHVPTRLLLLQRNTQGMTTNRLGLYIASLNVGSYFTTAPIIRQDGLARLNAGEVRSIEVTFAAPADLALLEEENVSGIRAVRELATTFNAPELTLTLTVGRSRDAHLNTQRSRGLLQRLLQPDVPINKLKAKLDLPEGVETVDLLKEALVVQEELDLPEGNPTANYTARNALLSRGFGEHIDYLLEQYGNVDRR